MPDKEVKPTVVETVTKSPILASLATMLAVIPVLISSIYFLGDIDEWLVSSAELEATKTEIINELRTEAANIRIILLNDLEDRLTDVEIIIDELGDAGRPIPSAVRRKAKTLHRRIQQITQGNFNQ